jgi:restriction system protein
MVGVVMTNQYFTEPAVKAAKKLKIMLWDRDYIDM